jgi:simple sugar transport system ATP-binding protein
LAYFSQPREKSISKALSGTETHIVLDVSKSLREKHVSVIFITHNIKHAYQVADHFIVLVAGEKL